MIGVVRGWVRRGEWLVLKAAGWRVWWRGICRPDFVCFVVFDGFGFRFGGLWIHVLATGAS